MLNPSLPDDDTRSKAAKNQFYGMTWLINTKVLDYVTNSLVQDYSSGNDMYPDIAKTAYSLAAATSQGAPGTRRSTNSSLVQGTRAGCGDTNDGRGCGGARPYRMSLGRKNRCLRCGSAQHFEEQCTNNPDSCGEEDREVRHNFNCG